MSPAAAAPPAPLGGVRPLRIGPLSRPVRPRAAVAGAVLVAVAVAAAGVQLGTGDLPLPATDVGRALTGTGDAAARFVVVDLRLPRVVTALLVGAALGMSGAVSQALTRNPLASPDLLGITAGAGAAAVAVVVVAGGTAGADLGGRTVRLGLPAAALAGGLVTALAVHVLARVPGTDPASAASGRRIVLVGVAAGAGLTAVTSWLLARAEIFEARQATGWLTGSLENRGWEHAVPVGVAVLVAGGAVVVAGPQLAALGLGRDVATGLGVRVGPAGALLHAASVTLAAVATAAAGPVAFVALVAPHLVRRTVGGGPSPVLAALVGAVLVLGADLAARTVLPGALPVGLVTAAFGAPFLLHLLATSSRRAG